MSAFDRIESGIPSMDRLLDSIRLGDNVVWQVEDLEEFRFFRHSLCTTGHRGRPQSDLHAVCRSSADS